MLTTDGRNRLKARVCLVVMAKSPVPGRVKTRLIPALGSRRATSVYRQLLADTLHSLSVVEGLHVLSCAPDIQHAVFRKSAAHSSWQCRPQPRGDLGSRMLRIISAGQRDADYTIIVGSDLANIDEPTIQRCIDKLKSGNDLVLGATTDGGYGLIAMPRLHAGVFRQIPWSTERVLQVTLVRARQLNLKTAVIEGLWDVDTYQDYRRWRQINKRFPYGKACVV